MRKRIIPMNITTMTMSIRTNTLMTMSTIMSMTMNIPMTMNTAMDITTIPP